MSLIRLLVTSIVITAVSLLATSLLIRDPGVVRAVSLGSIIALSNALLSCALVKLGERRSPNVFMGIVMWGMAGRLAAMAGLMIAAVRWFGLPEVPLAVSLLGHFTVLLALELGTFHKMRIPSERAA